MQDPTAVSAHFSKHGHLPSDFVLKAVGIVVRVILRAFGLRRLFRLASFQADEAALVCFEVPEANAGVLYVYPAVLDWEIIPTAA